ncbi:hypothetical protein BH24ACT12_BH24ACT12_13320 [soil metagenome]|jgi:probable phosphoglycerate mutase
MSDLQCAATVLVARHGEAEYETQLLSDAGGSLTRRGREQAGELGDALAARNIAMVYTSSMARAVQTAEIVAARVGSAVRVRDGLVELSVGNHAGQADAPGVFVPVFDRWRAGDLGAAVDGAESGERTVARVSGVLAEMADLHRGETVLALSHGGVMSLVLPLLAANLSDTYAFGQPLGDAAWVELRVDADGWRCARWGERRLDE